MKQIIAMGQNSIGIPSFVDFKTKKKEPNITSIWDFVR